MFLYSIRPINGVPSNRNVSFEFSLRDKDTVKWIKEIGNQTEIPWNLEIFCGYFKIKGSINLSNEKERLHIAVNTKFVDSLEEFLKNQFQINHYHLDKRSHHSRFIFTSFEEMNKFICFFGYPDTEALSKERAGKIAKEIGYEVISVYEEEKYLVVLSKDTYPIKIFPNWDSVWNYLTNKKSAL